jgi:choline/glycine/proline betaine transport protein
MAANFRASLIGIVAIALLIGGLSALQTVTIASALPFSVILLISIYGLLKALRRDLTKRESLSMATIAPTAARNPIHGRDACAISLICQSALL